MGGIYALRFNGNREKQMKEETHDCSDSQTHNGRRSVGCPPRVTYKTTPLFANLSFIRSQKERESYVFISDIKSVCFQNVYTSLRCTPLQIQSLPPESLSVINMYLTPKLQGSLNPGTY